MLAKMIDDRMAQRLGYLVAENKELFELLSELMEAREMETKASYRIADGYNAYIETTRKEHKRLYNGGKKNDDTKP